jgi:CspA family cold shock protein
MLFLLFDDGTAFEIYGDGSMDGSKRLWKTEAEGIRREQRTHSVVLDVGFHPPIVVAGTIAQLFPDKGVGFVRGESGDERFFHRTDVRDGVFENLRQGQRVQFEEIISARGPAAANIRVTAS